MSTPADIIAFPSRTGEEATPAPAPYAEMAAATNFSFLRGASTGDRKSVV